MQFCESSCLFVRQFFRQFFRTFSNDKYRGFWGHLFRANPTFYSFFPTTNCALRARWVTSPWGQKNMSSSQKNSPSGHFWKWTIGSPWLKSWPPPHLLLLSGITSSSSSSFPFPSSSHLSFTYLSYLVTSLSYLLSLFFFLSLSLSLSPFQWSQLKI